MSAIVRPIPVNSAMFISASESVSLGLVCLTVAANGTGFALYENLSPDDADALADALQDAAREARKSAAKVAADVVIAAAGSAQ